MGGQDSPDVAVSYINIGGVYYSQGQYEQALEYYQKGLEIKIKVSGQDHPDVATSKYNIARLKKTQGDLEGARRLFLECEQIYLKAYGPDHSETVDAARRASRCV